MGGVPGENKTWEGPREGGSFAGLSDTWEGRKSPISKGISGGKAWKGLREERKSFTGRSEAWEGLQERRGDLCKWE
jgi:hypothetical protein